MSKPQYPTNIQEAALALDTIKPGWHERIDVSKLNMSKYDDCILGQLFGFREGLAKFDKHPSFNDASDDKIFGCVAKHADWITAIEARHNGGVTAITPIYQKTLTHIELSIGGVTVKIQQKEVQQIIKALQNYA